MCLHYICVCFIYKPRFSLLFFLFSNVFFAVLFKDSISVFFINETKAAMCISQKLIQ